MAFKLESAMKIVAQVTGTKDVTKLTKALEGTEHAAKSVASGFKGMLSSKAFQAAAVGAAALSAGIALSTKAAIDFEDKMGGVLKVMDDMNETEVKALKKEIISLGQVLPIGVKGIADLYEAAGSGGLAREEMRAFAVDAGQVATAFDITANDAGQAMAEMRAALGRSQTEVKSLFDAMNYLGDNTASSAVKILEFMKRAAGAGKAAGLTAEQTASLGAAMTGMGVESRVAATALRNMVGALTAGSSMTDKQIDALARLGYAQEGATDMERRLTGEVETQSNRRIEIARNETDQISKEINRRYRDQMTALRDNLDDQNNAAADAVRDRGDAQVRALQRQMDRQLKIARDSGKSDVYAIRESWNARIDAVRDATNRELTVQRRASRDRLTAIQDRANDEKAIELKAVQDKFKATQAKEKEQLAIAKAEAKALAEDLSRELGTKLGKGLAEDMQNNAIGTITTLFEKINELPKPERLSVITELFGDQAARGVINLINNMDEYKRVIGLVGDETLAAGSVVKEFERKMQSAAAKLQLTKNAADGTAIAFGDSFIPAVKALATAITPVVNTLTWMLTNIPFLGPAIAIVSTAFIGLIAIAAPIAGLVGFLGTIGTTITAIGPIIGGVGAIISGSLMPILAPFLIGGAVIVGLIALGKLIGTVAGHVWAARGKIGAAIGGMLKWIQSLWTWATKAATALASLFRKRQQSSSSSGGQGNKKEERAAEGLFATGPTNALVGEAGGEYIVPSHKAAAFSKNYMGGMRGASAIPRFAEGGYTGDANISITTGPVHQLDGANYVTTQDMSRAVQAGVNQTLNLLAGDMRIRQQLGMA